MLIKPMEVHDHGEVFVTTESFGFKDSTLRLQAAVASGGGVQPGTARRGDVG
jgi:hypothetical protein